MHVNAGEFAIAVLAVAAGGLVQGTIGFGMNLVAVPVIAVVSPEALPATLVLLGLPLSSAMAARERHAVDVSGVTWITVGRLPGTVVGALIVAAVSRDALSALIGAAVLVAVAMSVLAGPIVVTRRRAFGAGVAAGVMGTAAAVDGPPLALLYQHHTGPALRATLATVFVIGALMSSLALAVAGALAGWQVVFALALVPALGVGLWASRELAPRLGARWLRPAVLTFASLAGISAIVRAVA